LPGIDRLVKVRHGLGLGGGVADRHHHRDGRGVEFHRVLNVDHHVVVEFGQDRGAGVRAQANRLAAGRRHQRAQHAARAHQTVRVLDQRHDAEIDTLDARGRPHDEAVVEREHHGAPGGRVEDPAQAVLHAPVEIVRSLEKKTVRPLRHADPVLPAVADII